LIVREPMEAEVAAEIGAEVGEEVTKLWNLTTPRGGGVRVVLPTYS
jgi:hypothetical protein